MPASPARIGFITNPVRQATAGPDAAVEAKYGKSARETDEPVDSNLETLADAQALADERLALLGADRRLVQVVIGSIDEVIQMPLYPHLPRIHMVDEELDLDRNMWIISIYPDFEKNECMLELWG